MKKRKIRRNVKSILVIILFIFLSCIAGFYSQRRINYKNEAISYKSNIIDTKEVSNVSMVMMGDALIHPAVYTSGSKYDHFFTYLDFSNYDLKYYNQETVLGGRSLGLSGYPQFNSPTEIGEAFVKQGFNLVSLATNHTLDNIYKFSTNAIKNSRDFWNKQEGVIAAGSYMSKEERDTVVIKEKNGIKYALLSYTISTNGINVPSGKDYLVNVYSDSKAKNDILMYRDKVDLLMVAMHWGDEYTFYPNSSQKRIAKYLSELGVNVIIGTHPHVVQPIDMVNDTLVIYSLGNFVSNQIGVERLTGLVASVNIIKTVYHGKTSISFSDITGELIYTNKNNKYIVYPYSKLNNSILNGYKDYYKKYSDIVTAYNSNVKMKGI